MTTNDKARERVTRLLARGITDLTADDSHVLAGGLLGLLRAAGFKVVPVGGPNDLAVEGDE